MTSEELFWDIAEPMYADPSVSRSTLMGFPCVRVNGEFFAMPGRDGQLVVKLPAKRVTELVESGSGQPFAPAGRVFREWVAVEDPDEDAWRGYLQEAKAFVSG